jgi:hypothetical protein
LQGPAVDGSFLLATTDLLATLDGETRLIAGAGMTFVLLHLALATFEACARSGRS